MAYDNTNRGKIWGNDKKEKDTHPDFTGSINVEGVEYWVSAWKRKPNDNPKAPALSFSIKRKDEQRSHKQDEHFANDPFADSPVFGSQDQDIPFAPLKSTHAF